MGSKVARMPRSPFEGALAALALCHLAGCARPAAKANEPTPALAARVTEPAASPYGSSSLGSKYQGQRGPTPSRYWQNFQ